MSSVSYEAHRGKALAVMAIVFLCGAAAGGVAVRQYDARVVAAAEVDVIDSEAITQDFVERMDLNAEQAQQVQELLDFAIMAEADVDHRKKMIRRETLDAIEVLLTHEQRIQFQQWTRRPRILSHSE